MANKLASWLARETVLRVVSEGWSKQSVCFYGPEDLNIMSVQSVVSLLIGQTILGSNTGTAHLRCEAANVT